MATAIQWTDETWNPVRGCSLVSEGCRNCCAMKTAARYNGPGQAYEGLTIDRGGGPKWTGEVRTVPKKLPEPLTWKRPRMVFVNSMSDLFHEDVPFDYVDQVFAVMALATRHTFQILTKRPERMQAYMATPLRLESIYAHWHSFSGGPQEADAWPLPNVWLGTSVENQKAADERIPHLLRTPAAVRFLSCEPLLGPVDLRRIELPKPPKTETQSAVMPSLREWAEKNRVPTTREVPVEMLRPIHGHDERIDALAGEVLTELGLVFKLKDRIDWVIVGGESGDAARICHAEWIDSIVRQCRGAGVAVFVKQLGSHWARSHGWKSPKGDDPSEWPEDLRVREWPAGFAGKAAS